MLIIPSGVKIHLALGHTDMRSRCDPLSAVALGRTHAIPARWSGRA